MSASMALGGSSMSLGMGNSSPIMSTGMGLNGNMTPSHIIIKREYCESGASSVHSPISTHSSPPSSTINAIGNSSSMSKGSGSAMHSNINIMHDDDDDGENSSGTLIGSNSNSSSSVDIFGSKCKRKINFSNLGMPGRTHQPATVARRNARERNRVKQVNNGFSSLKQHIPLGHRSKKMSKVETLRCAVDYIKNLQGLLNIHNHNIFNVASPADSNASSDMMMDDENMEELHQSSQPQQQQMNGVDNQRDGYALSSSSSSSSPTSSEFSAAIQHLPHHLAALHSHHQNNQQQQQHHHQQQHLGNNNNPLRHLSLSHHHLHGTNGVSVAAALLLESSSNAVTPNSNQLSPTSSEDPSSPSYASEVSYVNSNNSNGNLKGNGVYDYEKYEPVSPEDEELLDAIAWWQQS